MMPCKEIAAEGKLHHVEYLNSSFVLEMCSAATEMIGRDQQVLLLNAIRNQKFVRRAAQVHGV